MAENRFHSTTDEVLFNPDKSESIMETSVTSLQRKLSKLQEPPNIGLNVCTKKIKLNSDCLPRVLLEEI